MKFIRSTWYKYSKLGRGRKKKQVWRRPTGRDNKMREKKKGKPTPVSIGFKKSSKERNLLKGKKPFMVYNAQDLSKIGKDEIGVVANVGKKKKIEIAKKAQEKKYELYNMNPKKYLKENKPKNKSQKAVNKK